MTIIKPPTKFVGLHAHSLSLGDSIGLPKEHIDFAIENGMDALALTDHGHANGYSHQYIYWQELKKKGINFKAIPGAEMYFVDSLKNWQSLYDTDRLQKETAKLEKKSKSKKLEDFDSLEDLSDQHADTKSELDELTEGGAVVENEEESKKTSWRNPISKRSHLVLLPKNQEGLNSLFNMISLSYSEGFYRFPRIDMDMLRKYSKGNIVASTACVAGRLASIIFDHQVNPDWDSWGPNQDNFETIQKELVQQISLFQEALGGAENFYLELQFNRLSAQHLVNQHLIEASKRTGAPLVVTCDSHYSRPEHWREREIYKAMAWMNIQKDGFDKDALPKHISELKCELYPKNAEQVWDSYKETTKREDNSWNFYDDQQVKDAIERTHDIAHNQLSEVHLDRSVKLPALHRIVGLKGLDRLYGGLDEDSPDEDTVAFKALKQAAIDGLVWRKKEKDQVYIDRLRHELDVVKHLKFSKYFLTYSKIMNLVSDTQILGLARGSAAGSLLAYVLNITQVDPVKHKLLFARFLVKSKAGFPDIDCLKATTLVVTPSGLKQISSLEIGDIVLNHNGKEETVLLVSKRNSNADDKILSIYIDHGGTYGSIVATSKHRLLLADGSEIYARDISVGTKLHSPNSMQEVTVVQIEPIEDTIDIVDIVLSGQSTFQIVPFNSVKITTNDGDFLVTIHNYSMDTDLYDIEFRRVYYGTDFSRNYTVVRM